MNTKLYTDPKNAVAAGYAESESEARLRCAEWNAAHHKPGRLSLKAEYEGN